MVYTQQSSVALRQLLRSYMIAPCSLNHQSAYHILMWNSCFQTVCHGYINVISETYQNAMRD